MVVQTKYKEQEQKSQEASVFLLWRATVVR